MLVDIYKGIRIPLFLRWCRISSIHGTLVGVRLRPIAQKLKQRVLDLLLGIVITIGNDRSRVEGESLEGTMVYRGQSNSFPVHQQENLGVSF